jgi:hypothetical protein
MAQLPPKIPNMSPSWPDFSIHQQNIMPNMSQPNNIVTTTNNYHNNQNPSWVDEFLDFSSARRGAHRRSMSDSVTFLETPMLDDCSGKHNNNDNEFDKFDDEQFLSMFNDEIAGVHNMPPTLSSSNPSSPSDQNFVNDENETNKQVKKEMKKEEGYDNQLKNEPDEVESQCNQENSQPQNNNNATSSNDRITDPKRVKR